MQRGPRWGPAVGLHRVERCRTAHTHGSDRCKDWGNGVAKGSDGQRAGALWKDEMKVVAHLNHSSAHGNAIDVVWEKSWKNA